MKAGALKVPATSVLSPSLGLLAEMSGEPLDSRAQRTPIAECVVYSTSLLAKCVGQG